MPEWAARQLLHPEERRGREGWKGEGGREAAGRREGEKEGGREAGSRYTAGFQPYSLIISVSHF